ncbi:hypothetical protein C7S16_6767 [Burkholderia thailandensis]|uniref:Uncharacterized protein n=1 Tax=Burkholderia thailandensis TaxID=57975 RepID=A0AAW9CXS8_BURTH|nr:hypothetical protein [Burkholderia thailandensis]MDW9253637.1 hypothetical protein [Burkholderia thailandensis]
MVTHRAMASRVAPSSARGHRIVRPRRCERRSEEPNDSVSDRMAHVADAICAARARCRAMTAPSQ